MLEEIEGADFLSPGDKDFANLSARRNHYIIAIGASAGGLESIQELFDNFPANTDFSFVIIQHLSPDYKSLLADLLSRHTRMKVMEAENGTFLQPNTVYVIPTKKLMTLQYGKLRLTEKKASIVPNTAIDIFFKSLAEEKKECAIGIILSGTGTDGTKGIEYIKQNGGMVIVQDPKTAKFDGMPNSAIASGNFDVVATPKLIAEEIINYTKQDAIFSTLTHEITGSDEEILVNILDLIKEKTKQDFKAYKRNTISRRITRRIVFNKLDNIKSYYNFLQDNPDEIEILSKEFLIGVTKFFRDLEAFDILNKKVIPEIVASKLPGDTLKVWVAACSTGEEAYSIAILIKEHLQLLNKDLTVKIFASDIDKDAIDFASKGIYGSDIAKDITPDRLEKFFTKKSGRYLINPYIRKMVIFAHHNIIKDPPYSRMDFVSCRNMLIYMNSTLQKKVLATIHYSLNIGGYLFLGNSENPGEMENVLMEINRKWKIYKLVKQVQKGEFLFEGTSGGPTIQGRRTEKIVNIRPSLKVQEIFNEVIIEELSVAGLFINESHEIIQAIGDYKRFIQLPEKQLQFSILKMVPPEVALHLRIALGKAAKLNKKVSHQKIRVPEKNKDYYVHMVVKPFLVKAEPAQRFFFVLLRAESVGQSNSGMEIKPEAQNKINRDLFLSLEQELKETKENLHNAVEELETSNEELQSTNEELLSSNEELQSTNEELQSLNEELHTVNAEHQLKIKELIDLNDDLNNYFKSTNIGQIQIDGDLIIRKFTPAIVQQINIIESDIGRPLSHISQNFRYEKLIDDVRYVISTGNQIEKEIQVNDGRFYIMRIMPYIRQDKNRDGVVITFVEVTTLKQLNNIISGVLNSSINGIMAFKAVRDKKGKIQDFTCVLANETSASLLQKNFKSFTNRSLLEIEPESKLEGLFDKYIDVVEAGRQLNIEHETLRSGKKVWYQIAAVKMEDGFVVTFADITDKKSADEKIIDAYQSLKKAEEELRKLNNELEKRVWERTRELAASEERFRAVSLATNDVIWDWNLVTNGLWWNEGLSSVFGFKQVDLEPGIESWYNRIHIDDKEKVIQSLQEAINHGKRQWSNEFRFLKSDDSYAYIVGRGYVMYNEYNMPHRMVGSFLDLTNLKKVENELKKSNDFLRRTNSDLDNFVYTASHDLKAPIANLEGLVLNLREELKRNGNNVDYIFQLIGLSIERFKNTINELTEISKIQKNVNEDVSLVKIEELVDDIKINIADQIAKKQAIILISCKDCPEIEFSRKNLYSILYNFISNAIKYSSPVRQPLIEINTVKNNEYLILSVKDNGLGLDKDKLDKLFTMYKRFHDHVEGTGIGLYIVKKIMENSGGKVEVESTPGEGSVFKAFFKVS